MMSVSRFLGDLRSKGSIAPSLAAPRWLRWAWSLGVTVSPPLFWTAWANFVFHAERVSTVVLVITLASKMLGNSVVASWTLWQHIALCVACGCTAGVAAGWYYPRKAKLLSLPTWSAYTESVQTEMAD